MTIEPRNMLSSYLLQLRVAIERLTPEAASAEFCFFDIRRVARVLDSDFISATDLMDQQQLAELFNQHYQARCAWINLSGSGFLLDGRYAIATDVARKIGVYVTEVETRGSPLEANGQARKESRLLVGVLEQIAHYFKARHRPDLSERLLSCYERRGTGNWAPDQLETWSRDEIVLFVEAVRLLANTEATRGKMLSPSSPFFPGYLGRLRALAEKAPRKGR